jgi:hypothetical protein
MAFVSIGTATIQSLVGTPVTISNTQGFIVARSFPDDQLKFFKIQPETNTSLNDVAVLSSEVTETIINQKVFWS